MIINIRGTNGTGKSTLVNRLLAQNPERREDSVVLFKDRLLSPIKRDPERQIVKEIVATGGPSYRALGTYKNKCGGCDEYSWKGSHDWMCQGIRNWAAMFNLGPAPSSHLIFEGITVSSVFGRYVRLAQDCWDKSGVKTMWIILDIPLDTCLQRIESRSGKPITDRLRKNVGAKHEVVAHHYQKLVREVPNFRNFMDVYIFSRNEDAAAALGLKDG